MRIERLQNKLQQHIAQIIINDVRNPKIGFITITKVETSKDLDLAKVYFTVFNNDKKEETLMALKQTGGFIKTQLTKLLAIRKIPKLVFIIDKTMENRNKINQILEKIKL